VKGDPQGYTERLKQFVDSQRIALEYDSKIAPARGMSSGGKITLLPDLAPAEHFAVLVQEVAHELLHRGDRRKETTHTLRETEAEAVVFVVCSGIGLDSNTSSSDYIRAGGPTDGDSPRVTRVAEPSSGRLSWRAGRADNLQRSIPRP
jgi:hypothetical protein